MRTRRLTHSEQRELLLEMLTDPRAMLRRELACNPGTSEEVADGTGVSASTVRALRNGQVRDCLSQPWGALMRKLLVERYGESLVTDGEAA